MATHHPSSPYRTKPTPYASIPQSPGSAGYAQQQTTYPQHRRYQTHSASSSIEGPPTSAKRIADTTRGVTTGEIGGGFGPYAFPQSQGGKEPGVNSRFSSGGSDASNHEKPLPQGPAPQTNTLGPAYLWDNRDPDLDDALHKPDRRQDLVQDSEWTLWSARGWANYSALFILLGGLITLFCGYPIITFYRRKELERNGFNLGGINLTGQVPDLNLPSIIDQDTPHDVYSRTGFDGNRYNLVFSDEFEQEGRTFYPGDDPFWEAVDMHYWPTDDIQWYDPGQITTAGGALVITMEQRRNHNMNFMSGMMQSWNKLCFTGGYVEVAISLPGTADVPGFWPGAWTMGNLGRAGYGASTEGMWPYSYDTCDLGTFPNQTTREGTPAAALNGNNGRNGPVSYLPGQKLSACTCEGSDHPGPWHRGRAAGRAAPEIDILEAQIDVRTRRGQVSQSAQIAPFDYAYLFPEDPPATTIYDPELTSLNSYKGGVWQQALSAITYLNSEAYTGASGLFSTYGFEYNPSRGDDGYITWAVDGKPTWTITNTALAPNAETLVGQRLISEEPMYLVLNFGMSPGFQGQDFLHLVFPNKMLIDYVRVYQRDGREDIGCSPDHHPTEQYILDHIAAYTNPNLTRWDSANFTFPRNSEYDGC